MNPELPQLTREELEVRLTALLLGELAPAEAEAIRQLATKDASLGQTLARLETAMKLVREGLAGPDEAASVGEPPMKLSAEKRDQLLAHFKQPAPATTGEAPVAPPPTPEEMGVRQLRVRRRRRQRSLWGAGAVVFMVALVAAFLLPALQQAKQRRHWGAERGMTFGAYDSAKPLMPRLALKAERLTPTSPTPLPQATDNALSPSDPAPVTLATPATPVPQAVPPPEVERLHAEIALPKAAEWSEADNQAGVAGAFAAQLHDAENKLAPDAKPAGTAGGVSAWGGFGGGLVQNYDGGGGMGGGGAGGRAAFQAPAETPPTTTAPAANPVVVAGKPASQTAAGTKPDSSEGAAFVAGATGSAPLNYQWRAGNLAQMGSGLANRADRDGDRWENNAPGPATLGADVRFGNSADVATKFGAVERQESRGRGLSRASGEAAGRGNVPAEDYFANVEGRTWDASGLASVGGQLPPPSGPAAPPGERTLSLSRQSEAQGRRPARPSAAPAATVPLSTASARGELAQGQPVAGALASAPQPSLPMPALKGAPMDLPTGANIESLDQTVAEQRAKWGTIVESAAATPAPGSPPPVAISPEMTTRFYRRYGIATPNGGPGGTAALAKEAADAKKSLPTLGDEPLAGGLFAARKRVDQAASERQPEVAAKAEAENTSLNLGLGRMTNVAVDQLAIADRGGVAWAYGLSPSEPRAASKPNQAAERGVVLPDVNGLVGGESADGLIRQGKALYESGQSAAAVEKFAKAKAQAPANHAANYYFDLSQAAESAKTSAKNGRTPTAQTEVTTDWVAKDAPVTTVAGRALTEGLAQSDLTKKLAEPQSGLADGSLAAKRTRLDDLRANYDRLLKTTQHLDVNADVTPETARVMERAKAGAPSQDTLWNRTKSALGAGQTERSARVIAGTHLNLPENAPRTEEFANYLETQAQLARSSTVLKRVADKLNLSDSDAKQLEQNVAVTVEPGSSTFDIRAKDANPARAAQIANAVADEYLGFKQQLRAATSDSSFTRQAEDLARLKQEIKQLESDVAAAGKQPVPAQPTAEPPPPPRPPANAPIPQPEVATAENSFSTFSLNVADVSFKLAAASLDKGVLPEVASLRSEEFLNAFDYRDPEAAPGTPVAFAWERARDPFAHNRDFLRFSLKTAASGRPAGRALNLVLLMDNSGSMERADRAQIIQQAVRVLAGQLQPQDRISVVTFSRTPRLWLDAVAGDKAREALEQISTLTPQGGTDLGAALKLAYSTAVRHYQPGGLNRVVLLTDGAANLGDVDPDSLKRQVEASRKQGIALDCFGIGWEGYNDDLLEVLSRNGDGRYGFVNTPEAAEKEFASQLAGALQVSASDVKVQVEFNPERVTNWRQIGYAKHQLTKEQFRDNTVDAAEIAAQEAGNGLYVIETNPQGNGPLATVRVRYKVPGTTDYRELEWPVPYAGAAVPLAQSSPAMRLAASATAFSEWLAGSPFAAEVSPDHLLALLSDVPNTYSGDKRPRELQRMILQAKSIAGK